MPGPSGRRGYGQPGAFLTRRLAIAVFVALAMIAGAAGNPAAFAQTPPTQADVDFELEAAKAEQASAARSLDQARQWRALAEQARKSARTSLQQKDKNRWNRDARKYDRSAAKLEEKAARLTGEAKRKEAKAKKLQKRLSAASEAEERRRALEKMRDADRASRKAAAAKAKAARPPKMKRKEVLGVWLNPKDQSPFVVVQQDQGFTAYPNRLEAHTMDRVWKGIYEPVDEGDTRRYENARVTFTYKPKPEEMNPKIPLWARKQVKGKLEWRIELDEAGTCGSPRLKGKWYPGEVSWRKDGDGASGKARVSGKGKPRELSLDPDTAVTLVTSVRPRLAVHPANAKDMLASPIEALIKSQLFFVKVYLPPELAKNQGPSLTVKITGKTGGGATSLKLTKSKERSGRLFVYTHKQPVAIADRNVVADPDRDPSFLSFFWILGVKGARLGLKVKDGESVEFRYGKAAQTIPVYNTYVQRALARYKHAIPRLRAIYSSTLSGRPVGKGQKSVLSAVKDSKKRKEEAHKRLLMLKNLETLLASTKLHDRQRLDVAHSYLNGSTGLLIMTPHEHWQEDEYVKTLPISWNFDRDGRKHRSGFYDGVVWSSVVEYARVHRGIKESTKQTREDAKFALWLGVTYALYDYVAMRSGVDDYVIVLADVPVPGAPGWKFSEGDIFAKKVTRKQRLLAALGIGMARLRVMKHAPRWFSQWAFRVKDFDLPSFRTAFPGSPGFYRLGKRTRFSKSEPADGSADAGRRKLPRTVDPARLLPGADKVGTPAAKPARIGCGGAPPRARPGGKRPRSAPGEPDQARMNRPEDFYGNEVTVVSGQVRPPQQFETCNPEGMLWGMKGQNGVDISVIGALRIVAKNKIIDLSARDAATHPLKYGMTNAEVGDLATVLGAKWTYVVGRAPGGRATLDQIKKYHDQGYVVKVVVDVGPKSIPHAILIDKLVTDAKGKVIFVEYKDPAFGKILRLPCKAFTDRMHTGTGDTNAFPQIFKWSAGGGSTVRPTIEPPRSQASGPRPPGAKPRPSQIPGQTRTIHEALDDYYRGKAYDPLHVTSVEFFRKIRQDRQLDYPAKGGATFSPGGKVGSVSEGNAAIRIKPEYAKNNIKWVKTPQGLVAWNYLKGKDAKGNWIGQHKTYIKTKNLQIFVPGTSPGQGRWMDIPQPPKKN